MKYIINESNDTAYNIALEEYAFKKLLNEDMIFLLWINKPSIIVGRHQNTIEEINKEYVRDNNIEVVRRISGGGAVYHDYNNLNYTIISKEDENRAFDFKSFSIPVIKTLESLGVKAEFTGRNDLEIDGKKICGNAQAYINGRIMHHGCLLFDVDLSVLSKALKVSKDKIESKGVKSVRARVTNIVDELPNKITVEEFKDLLLDYMKKEYPEMTEYVFSEEEIAEINKAKEEKFGNWDWNYGKSPEYNLTRSMKFEKGKIEVFVNVIDSKIENIKIYGDFFGIEDVSAVEDVLRGAKYEQKEVLERLNSINISRYFAGISAEEVMNAIVE
ncbi:lipoate--protein ligase [Streptobacillus moniliformis]|uniref:lipoate--protein ligase n=1 Tax=Streptobacillus moniliformis (strain ATCC 14647 / DSM 12112 / NCTC 10651 / 9901) TaxID=519441 RepID=D1AVA8_STRM9|nr:lipoate--protein ligase [Streptobacillus moniliformis]ACZ01668.1 lipoyltransferase and lipoate-protein ligase [Streptobacillus moniliformis DSM 12112]AVL43333.1 lipoate--protein ligase [Streptobacillus moniliformis]QXW66340.1 lipoate--protein ligase [Streptobacillus moniliformis]SQA13154.1 Lipoate-protein ligase LplJ [Streptobacillus moniliformis]